LIKINWAHSAGNCKCRDISLWSLNWTLCVRMLQSLLEPAHRDPCNTSDAQACRHLALCTSRAMHSLPFLLNSHHNILSSSVSFQKLWFTFWHQRNSLLLFSDIYHLIRLFFIWEQFSFGKFQLRFNAILRICFHSINYAKTCLYLNSNLF
jgi:hypothetical protein